jgi:hypothetical protein
MINKELIFIRFPLEGQSTKLGYAIKREKSNNRTYLGSICRFFISLFIKEEKVVPSK